MKLVAVRHAKPVSEGYAEDFLRPLSDEGKAVHRKLSEALVKEGIEPIHIFSSPLVRAMESAYVMGEVFGVGVSELPALGDEFDPAALIDLLQSFSGEETVIFVGHAPTMAKFVHDLSSDEVLLEGLGKSEAAIVEFDGEAAEKSGKFLKVLAPGS